MNIRILTGGLLAATSILIGLKMNDSGYAQEIKPCIETFQMQNALSAIFPSTQFGTPLRSFCEDPGAMGADTAGILLFGPDTDVSQLTFGPLDDIPEGMPIDRFDRLYPAAALADKPSDHLAAYGFSRELNSGAYVVRRSDGTGPVMIMVADLM